MQQYLLLSASSLFLLFFVGEFIGINGFSRRPKPRTTMWNINLVFAALWLIAITLLLFDIRSGVLLTLALSILWFIAQIRAHWIPYVLGAPYDYQQEYTRIFKNTISVLPQLTKRGIVPNLYHTLIAILLVFTILSGLRVFLG